MHSEQGGNPVEEVWDTRDAFKPGSGRFGAMVIPAARVVRYDARRGKWVCDMENGEVVIADSKSDLEQFLDWNDNRKR